MKTRQRLTSNNWDKYEGTPAPLGATWIPQDDAWNFALYSKHAETVELRFYREDSLEHPVHVQSFSPRRNKSGPVWHCRVPSAATTGAEFYAYRVSGPPPASDFELHQFDSEKLLLDPYARDVYFPPGFDRQFAVQPGSNEGRAPLAMLMSQECPFDWQDDYVMRHGSDLVIYELHVRGFTVSSTSGIPAQNRGTFAGVVDKIPYLQNLGVTAVELMPVFQFDPQGEDYWGYMPLNFFSPHDHYVVDPGRCTQDIEFRTMVQALHAAGIEVILDVVFNHTCEGDHFGPTYSLKGIDTSTYYVLTGDATNPYANFSGTGNTLHTANRATRRLIVDSLRYWVKEMHVDGFRFDLASIFTRNSDGSINRQDPPIFGQISADPDLAGIRLIAEPWDASGAFQLGTRFPGLQWMQWNAAFRDDIRRFVRGDPGMVGSLMTRVYGSSDLFPDQRECAQRPFQSINYVTSHDGFTLSDLVSYNKRNNSANGYNNVDGHEDLSWNCGWEGIDDVPAHVTELRQRQVKFFFTLLMLSNGTPMFRMGDEFMQTQHGNNNPFNQDNEISWLNWDLLNRNQDLFRFARETIAFRKRHPSIARSTFWRSDVYWYGADRAPDLSVQSQQIAWCLHGKSEGDDDLYVMVNGGQIDVTFGIHEGSVGQWRLAICTSELADNDVFLPGTEPLVEDAWFQVASRSVAVLLRSSDSPQLVT